MSIHACIRDSFSINITAMNYLPSLIVSLMLLCLWSCVDMGDPISCSEGLDCAGECGGTLVFDCAGTCNGSAIKDVSGNCTNISYSATVQPLFITDMLCTSCHGGASGLFLDSYDNLISGDVVVAFDSTTSKLIIRLKLFIMIFIVIAVHFVF